MFACMKVVVIAQYWGDEYYHFLVEALPRITLMLDVLVENLDIKVLFSSVVSCFFRERCR